MNEDGIVLRVGPSRYKSEAGLGRIRVNQKARDALGAKVGDYVEIVGKRSTAAKLFKSDEQQDGDEILMDSLTRDCAGVGVGDKVRVILREKVTASKVTVAPDLPGGRLRITGDKHRSIRDGLENRPIMAGDKVDIPNIFLGGNLARYCVVSTVPAGVVSIGQSTALEILDEPVKTSDISSIGITYDDVGGLDEELGRIRDMIELPLKHPELFERLGISSPKGVLLYGPPGTGKTLIAKALARESGASFHSVNGPEIVGKYYGESEEQLRAIFDKAVASAPSIIFIDEIDSIAPKRDEVYGEVEKRIVAQLLTLMDGMSSDKSNVVVIAATNREDAIDPALRRPGRFDREIEIGVPNKKGRADILGVHLRGMPLDKDVDINALASATQGFVGADLASLAREAAMKCLGRHKHLIDMNSDEPSDIDMKVTMKDFTDALSDIDPSAMREITIDVPDVSWDDIGGLDSIKEEIRDVFVPAEEKKEFQKLGIKVPKGVLLYGPPGTGKTMIAKAAANEAGVNFICISGPEIASKWLGESEKGIRTAFKKAKQIAPCILFFDEFDAIAPIRVMYEGPASSAWERVVNQLLTSMDGVEDLSNVSIMAATNRPDMIDPALLRPGRLDRKIYIGVPGREDRLKILSIHSKNMPLKDVDLGTLADMTDGYVGADLAELCREAGMCAYREDRSADCVRMEHFQEALKTVPPSVTKDDVKRYENLGKEMNKRKANYSGNPLYG